MLAALAFSKATAQDSAYLACHYAESYKENLMKPDHVYQDEMVLRIGRHSSEFFSLWCREHRRVRDSVSAKGGGTAEILAACDKLKYPSSTQEMTLYKNYPEAGTLTGTDKLFRIHTLYTEPLAIPQWTIRPEKKEVAGHECQKATTTFYGRNWTAWFAADIPVQDGPWKLCGLPGLILEAEDEEGHYKFKCMELKKLDTNIPIELPDKKYLKCDKKKYFEMATEYYNDMFGFIRRTTGLYVGSDEKGDPQARFNNIER